MPQRKKKQKSKVQTPLYCDFSCPHSNFSVPEVSGACRRDLSVYCTLFKTYNSKHSLCLEKKK